MRNRYDGQNDGQTRSGRGLGWSRPAARVALAGTISLLVASPSFGLDRLERRSAGDGGGGGPGGRVEEIIVDQEGVRVRRPGSPHFMFLDVEKSEDRDSRRASRARKAHERRGDSRRERESFGFETDGKATFDRVNGLSIWTETQGSGTGSHVPEIHLASGYAFSRERWYYDVGILQPIVKGRSLMAGGKIYRLTPGRDFDEEIIGEPENSLAAVLFKEDYRDYFQATGGAFLLESRLGESQVLRGSYRRDDLKSLGLATKWSIFHRDREFRRNDPVQEGILRGVELAYSLDKRDSRQCPTRGIYWRFRGERAGRDGLGGDFYFDRLAADLRQHTKLGPNLFLDFRVAGGYLEVNTSGEHLYPVHKEFYVGGVSTLPGYSHKEFRGDRLLLANVEYRIGGDSRIIFLADAGDAWAADQDSFDAKADVGVGFEAGDQGFRVMVAERLDKPEASPVWWLRLQRTF